MMTPGWAPEVAWTLIVVGLGGGTLSLGAAAVVTHLLRRGDAADCHAVWMAGLGAALALPVVGAGSATPPAPFVPLALPLLLLWGTGVALLGLRWATHHLRIRRLSARARSLPPGHPLVERVTGEVARRRLRRRVRVLVSGEMTVPATWGVLRPTLLLPREADRWPPDELEAVVVHELAHVERLDAAAQVLGEVVRALYWPHPLAWWARAAAARVREAACDAEVLRRGVEPRSYARVLVAMARRGLGSLPAAALDPASAGAATPAPGDGREVPTRRSSRTSPLARRVGQILAGPPPAAQRGLRPTAALAAAAFVGLAAVPLLPPVVVGHDGPQGPTDGAAGAAYATHPVASVRALAGSCDPGTGTALARILRTDPFPDVRAEAARVLGDRADPRTASVLAGVVGDTGERMRVRRAALLGLRTTDTRTAALAAVHHLRDRDPGLRLLAVGALETMPRQSRWTRPHLARTLRTDADPRVRARAVTALSRSAGEAALGILLQARWDDSHQVRVRVREALARMEIT